MDSAYKAFFKKFTSLYGKVFEKLFGYGKIKNNKKIVDKKGNSKIFKNKAKTYDKFLKSKTDELRKVLRSTVNYLNRLNKVQSHNITPR